MRLSAPKTLEIHTHTYAHLDVTVRTRKSGGNLLLSADVNMSNVNCLIRKLCSWGNNLSSWNQSSVPYAFRTCSVPCYARPPTVGFHKPSERSIREVSASATSCQTSVMSRTNIVQPIAGDALHDDGNYVRVIDHIQGHVRRRQLSGQGLVVQRVRSCHSLSAKLATDVLCRAVLLVDVSRWSRKNPGTPGGGLRPERVYTLRFKCGKYCMNHCTKVKPYYAATGVEPASTG
jgi:hypothetical protein